jgi:DNA polymerase III alpha subunit (gram-positive type)
MVRDGAQEKYAIQTINNFLPRRSIILAHNAPFDREVFRKTYEYWKRHEQEFQGLHDHHFIFVDSKEMLSSKLKTISKALADMYSEVFKGKTIPNQHTASADVNALFEIIREVYKSNDRSIENSIKEYVTKKKDLKGSIVIFKEGKILQNEEMHQYLEKRN